MPTPDGGTHEQGLRAALTKGLRAFGELVGQKKAREIGADDVIGGAEIFRLALPFVGRIELTEVLEDIPGDTIMPDPRDSGAWRETWREEHAAVDGRPPFAFVTLERA